MFLTEKCLCLIYVQKIRVGKEKSQLKTNIFSIDYNSIWHKIINLMTLGINQCLSILNEKLLAHVFGEDASAEKLKIWGIEAYSLYRAKRHHYIMDEYASFLNAGNSPKLLDKLQTYRDYYKDLSFDEGPYHFEVFPYLYFSPEKELLANKGKIKYDKNLSEDIEDLIVELNLI